MKTHMMAVLSGWRTSPWRAE
ncbi:trp operon leader peptide [Rahnella aquatilis CIP 78.65 = ATCC 33071]|nr:trp operon leader peptide [Rahnella aquatilis CIP 78.65 = ATCC 33071]